jgi:hypothetical protein
MTEQLTPEAIAILQRVEAVARQRRANWVSGQPSNASLEAVHQAELQGLQQALEGKSASAAPEPPPETRWQRLAAILRRVFCRHDSDRRDG